MINKKNGPCFAGEEALLLKVFSHNATIAIKKAMLFDSMVGSSTRWAETHAPPWRVKIKLLF